MTARGTRDERLVAIRGTIPDGSVDALTLGSPWVRMQVEDQARRCRSKRGHARGLAAEGRRDVDEVQPSPIRSGNGRPDFRYPQS